jgi:peptidoglycan-associated lipoprotein
VSHRIQSLCIALALVAPACASKPQQGETTTAAHRDASLPKKAASAGALTSGADRACALPTIYFGFDSDQLDERARATLADNAGCFRQYPEQISLVGGTDERGTEEYNVALGERRARAVQSYLKAIGVEEARLRVTSVGEEEATGQDEEGYARDRRVAVSR